MRNQTNENTLLSIPIPNEKKEDILEHIEKVIRSNRDFYSIVSLNPEILVESKKNPKFKEAIIAAQMRIIDGSGVSAAAKLKGIRHGSRYTGVELMGDLLKIAHKRRLRVMLLGGLPKVADKVVECQVQAGNKAIFTATYGIKDRQSPTRQEEARIFSIVAQFRPHILLVAFGSPYSELWLYSHQQKLKGIVCASVGGAFDYFAGTAVQPSPIIRKLGIEYLVRLMRQPWRWRRQLNLLTFVRLAILEAIAYRIQKI